MPYLPGVVAGERELRAVLVSKHAVAHADEACISAEPWAQEQRVASVPLWGIDKTKHLHTSRALVPT